jgi:hypothetical protein
MMGLEDMFTIRFFDADDERRGEERAASLVEAIDRAALLAKNSNLARAPDQQPIVRYIIADAQGRQVHEQFVGRE